MSALQLQPSSEEQQQQPGDYTQRTHQRRGEGGGFMDLRRMYLIWDQPADIKDPVPHSADRAQAEQSVITDRLVRESICC